MARPARIQAGLTGPCHSRSVLRPPPRLAGVLDLVVVAAVALGAFAGWRRGFIMPAVAAATGLASLWALYGGPAAGLVPGGVAGIGVGLLVLTLAGSLLARVVGAVASLVYRVGPLKRVDQGLGVPLGAVTGLVAVYVALAAVVSFDGLLAPLHGAVTVDQAAVAALRTAMTANPQLGMVVDPSALDALARQATKAAIPSDQLATFDSTLALYETEMRPQLLRSTLGPILLAWGERAPFIGRHLEYPTK